MNRRRYSRITVGLVVLGAILAACAPTPPATACEFTANSPLSAFRLPDGTSDFFGTIPTGETHEALARTADGWIGFDPGIAQAGNIGLAHHRWVQLNATVSPSCLSGVDLVTLADVQADVAASGS
jgi:hypothetical protein